ncbi:hypothetical protein BST45_13730 [Mycobacterium shinjukuense]|nr:hypothetical protein BST45_13730 [Mycobacterium shinjukuense]
MPIRVLDCGSGTGAFTDQIVNHLRPRDTFDVVELNGAFVRTLKNRFATDPRWRGVQDITTIHELPLQEFRPAAPYDFIISGLPHGNFSCSLVEEIITCYITLLKPEGVLSYVEYMYMRSIRKTVTLGTARSRVRAVDSMMMSHLGRHQVTRDSVFKNMPPAWVHHLTALNAVPVEQAA